METLLLRSDLDEVGVCRPTPYDAFLAEAITTGQIRAGRLLPGQWVVEDYGDDRPRQLVTPGPTAAGFNTDPTRWTRIATAL